MWATGIYTRTNVGCMRPAVHNIFISGFNLCRQQPRTAAQMATDARGFFPRSESTNYIDPRNKLAMPRSTLVELMSRGTSFPRWPWLTPEWPSRRRHVPAPWQVVRVAVTDDCVTGPTVDCAGGSDCSDTIPFITHADMTDCLLVLEWRHSYVTTVNLGAFQC